MSEFAGIEIAPTYQRKVARTAAHRCWEWTGSLTTQGYGQTRVKMDGRWRSAGAHQVAHFLATGRWERQAEGRLVRHLCHNRRCCNPAHLRGGTPQENMADRVARREGQSLLPPPAGAWIGVGQFHGAVMETVLPPTAAPAKRTFEPFRPTLPPIRRPLLHRVGRALERFGVRRQRTARGLDA